MNDPFIDGITFIEASCPICDGSGVSKDEDHELQLIFEGRCSDCNGTGKRKDYLAMQQFCDNIRNKLRKTVEGRFLLDL